MRMVNKLTLRHRDIILGTGRLRAALDVAIEMLHEREGSRQRVLDDTPAQLLEKVDAVVMRFTESAIEGPYIVYPDASVDQMLDGLFSDDAVNGMQPADKEILVKYFKRMWWDGGVDIAANLDTLRTRFLGELKDAESSVLFFDYVNITRRDDSTTRERAERARKTARLTNTIQKTTR